MSSALAFLFGINTIDRQHSLSSIFLSIYYCNCHYCATPILFLTLNSCVLPISFQPVNCSVMPIPPLPVIRVGCVVLLQLPGAVGGVVPLHLLGADEVLDRGAEGGRDRPRRESAARLPAPAHLIQMPHTPYVVVSHSAAQFKHTCTAADTFIQFSLAHSSVYKRNGITSTSTLISLIKKKKKKL